MGTAEVDEAKVDDTYVPMMDADDVVSVDTNVRIAEVHGATVVDTSVTVDGVGPECK